MLKKFTGERVKATQERTKVSSQTNYRYFNTEQNNERISNLRAEVIQNRREIKKGKDNIDAMHVKMSIVVDDMLREDLESIMTEMTENVQKNQLTIHLGGYFGSNNSKQTN